MLKKYFPRCQTKNVVTSPVVELPTEDDESQDTTPSAPPPTPEMVRPRYRHRYNTRFSVRNILSTILIAYVLLSSCLCYELVDRVQWTPTDQKAYDEVITYNFVIEYHSPCDLLRLKGPESSKEILEWCEDAFKTDFVEEFENRCHSHTLIRIKREVTILCVALIGFAGTAIMGGVSYAIYKLNGWNYDQLKKELNQIREKVKQEADTEIHVKKALEYGGLAINKTRLFADFAVNNVKNDIALSIVIAHKLAEINNIISDSKDKDGTFRITEELLTALNATLPCQNCPIDMTSLLICNIKKDRNIIYFVVSAKRQLKSLVVLKADPFEIYSQREVDNCHTEYTGPETILFDNTTRCAIPMKDKREYIPYAKKTIQCESKQFREWSKMETTTCNVENTFREFQVKWGLDQNLIYCYNTNITINKRIHECPSEPFRLKNTSNFEVGRFIHYGTYWPLFKSVTIFGLAWPMSSGIILLTRLILT